MTRSRGPLKALTIDDIPLEYLWCRVKSHNWMHQHDKVTAVAYGRVSEFVSISVCERCTTEIKEKISTDDWEVGSRAYDYPDYYLLADPTNPDGTHRYHAADFRKALMEARVKKMRPVAAVA